MKKRSFAYGAIILAVCSILAKLLGGVYRIALTSALGAEGIFRVGFGNQQQRYTGYAVKTDFRRTRAK